jgi:hypothetical protein
VGGAERRSLVLVSDGGLDGPQLLLVDVPFSLLPPAVQNLGRTH